MTNTNTITIVHDPNAPVPSDGHWGSNKPHPLWEKGLIIGLFAESWESNFSDDWRSGIVLKAIVWNQSLKKAEITVLMQTEGCTTGPVNTAWKADATPFVMAQFTEWMKKEFFPKWAKDQAERESQHDYSKANRKYNDRWDEESRINRGDTVTVVAGRKYAHGLTGKMFWSGVDNFGKTKIGVAMSDRKDAQGRNVDVMWIALSNVEKVLSDDVKAQLKALSDKADSYRTESYKANLATAKFAEVSGLNDADMLSVFIGDRRVTSALNFVTEERMESQYGGSWR